MASILLLCSAKSDTGPVPSNKPASQGSARTKREKVIRQSEEPRKKIFFSLQLLKEEGVKLQSYVANTGDHMEELGRIKKSRI